MITNADITIFHKEYDPNTRLNIWHAAYFKSVSFESENKVNVLDKGLESASLIKIRIPTEIALDIANGDKVALGNVSTLPDTAYTIIGFADNRRGTTKMHHWKVICN